MFQTIVFGSRSGETRDCFPDFVRVHFRPCVFFGLVRSRLQLGMPVPHGTGGGAVVERGALDGCANCYYLCLRHAGVHCERLYTGMKSIRLNTSVRQASERCRVHLVPLGCCNTTCSMGSCWSSIRAACPLPECLVLNVCTNSSHFSFNGSTKMVSH